MYYLTQIVKLYIPNEIPLAFGLNKVHSFPILDLWRGGGGGLLPKMNNVLSVKIIENWY